MAVTPYKVLAEEVAGTEQAFPVEILMSGANSVFAPVAASGPAPANPADNVQTAITNAQGINNTYFVSTTTATTSYTATTFTPDTLTVTPAVGTYAIWYNADAETSGVNAQADFELFVDGVGLGESLRSIQQTTAILGLITLSTSTIQAPVTIVDRYSFNGSQVLTVRYRISPATSGAGGVILGARTLLLMQTGLT